MVNGTGPTPCIGMVIGEAPGAQEERLGVPFIGPSGEKLNEALEAAGWDRDKLFITNLYKFRPPGNRQPTEEEIAEHRIYLLDEFQRVMPSYVLLLGNTAAREFIDPNYRGTRDHGQWIFRLTEGERTWFLPTYHPSYVLRNRGRIEDAFFADVRTFVCALVGQDIPA